MRGVARILEKRGQKCKVIAHKVRKNFLDRMPCLPVKSCGGAGYSICNVDSPDTNPRSALARS